MNNLLIATCILILTMCNSNKQATNNKTEALAPVIIYKTKADYSNYIPVIMDDTKAKIISYPGIQDIFRGSEYAKPVKLKDGFLLDKFGISPNSVYTSFTFDEYAKLKNVPSLEVLKNRIVDFDPFIEIYRCKIKPNYSTVDEINELIENKLAQCDKIN